NDAQAILYKRKAADAAEKGVMLGDPAARLVKVSALAALGINYQQVGDRTLAMEQYQKCLQLMAEPGESYQKHLISMVRTLIGNIWLKENNGVQAVASYQEALRVAEETDDKVKISETLAALSRAYPLLGDYREALVCVEKAVKIAEQVTPYYLPELLVVNA